VQRAHSFAAASLTTSQIVLRHNNKLFGAKRVRLRLCKWFIVTVLSNDPLVVNIQQLNHLFKAVEKSTYSVISNQFSHIMAFHNPVNGIKNMITDEINKSHDTIKIERATRNLEHFNSTTAIPESTPIPRRKSFNDMKQKKPFDPSRIIVSLNKEEVDSILETKPCPQANDAQQNRQSNVATIPGSYSENFRPPPERVPRPSQKSNDGRKTPINLMTNQTPGSYHGEIQNIGDNLMRNLDHN
jgi:hypothetical protein